MKKVAELRKLEDKTLKEELHTAERELFKIRFDVSNNQSKSVHLIDKNKKYIAQIKTVMKEKENSLEKAV